MKISYNWLNEFIDLPLSAEDTAEKLTLIGLEVEGVETYGSLLKGVIVGGVDEVKDHPNADRLKLCNVSLGHKNVQIVCGAKNVAAGQKVPVATVGSTLPVMLDDGTPLTIRKAKLRGEPSEGMICAEDELGLGNDHAGIMVLDENTKIGTPVSEVFDLYHDTIIDIAITPNRPDATCHLGVARDLAAALDLELKVPFENDFDEAIPLNDFDIEIKSPEKCHRYVGKLVEGVGIGESPAWLKNRLKALGVRPVNNVVDVTNYVMFELGQPLHAFDRSLLKGNKIIVRDFDKDIEFETLDHIKRKCPAGTLFICDGKKPVAIAGVMGGVDSEVNKETSNILIESAYFDPGIIRKTAKRQALQTEASYRFERGIDPNLQRIAAERAARLIVETAGGAILNECSDVHPVKAQTTTLSLRKSYTNRLLGTRLSINEIAELLDGLGLSTNEKDEKTITYEIPSFRPDLQREVDLIEEVGRLYDYNNIPTPEHGSFHSPEAINDWEKLNSKIKELAKGMRFREIYSNSLISEQDAQKVGNANDMLHTLNPISTDMTTLRPSLLHGFLQSAAYNFNRGASGVRFFETGHVFKKAKNGSYYKGVGEESHLLLGLAGYKTIENWNTDPAAYTLFDLKAAIPGFLKSLNIAQHTEATINDSEELVYSINGVEIGKLYAVQPSLLNTFEIELPTFVAEFSITRIFELKKDLPSSSYEPVSKFPAFEFDVAVVVDTSLHAELLLKKIKQTAGSILNDIRIFDVFEGESLGKHKKSLAFRLSFLDKNKTLTIKDVQPIIEEILEVLDDTFLAKLRS